MEAEKIIAVVTTPVIQNAQSYIIRTFFAFLFFIKRNSMTDYSYRLNLITFDLSLYFLESSLGLLSLFYIILHFACSLDVIPKSVFKLTFKGRDFDKCGEIVIFYCASVSESDTVGC